MTCKLFKIFLAKAKACNIFKHAETFNLAPQLCKEAKGCRKGEEDCNG